MKSKFVNYRNIQSASKLYKDSKPFEHCIVDGFFDEEWAQQLESSFLKLESANWWEYNNPLEIKKTSNNWEVFDKYLYQTISYLSSADFVEFLSNTFGISPLFADPGLNGGGLHIHKRGGKLNTHLDYSVHPKLDLQRKLNLLVYLNSNWHSDWGGDLGLWEQVADTKKPGRLAKQISPLFNRAVLFDTTQDSWHGLPEPINCPENETRRSLALYYLVPKPEDVDPRGKALFAPYGAQDGDAEIEELIQKRAGVTSAAQTYRKD